MNAYATAIASGNYATLWICTDCLCLHANGEYDPERPAELPEPLSLIPASADLSAGLLAEHHAHDCEPQTRDADRCDCVTIPHATRACDGCGDHHHGRRHAMTLVYDQRPQPAAGPTTTPRPPGRSQPPWHGPTPSPTTPAG